MIDKIVTKKTWPTLRKSAVKDDDEEVHKQHDRWCHTHGCDTMQGHHLDGKGKNIECEKPDPNHKEEATMKNPMGGNSSRDGKAWKWWVGPPNGHGGRVVDKK